MGRNRTMEVPIQRLHSLWSIFFVGVLYKEPSGTDREGVQKKGELWDDKKGSIGYLFLVLLQFPTTVIKTQIGIPIKALLNCTGDLILLGGGPSASVSLLDNQGLLVWIP